MSKIRISLNEVFRKHIIQLIYTYEKYIGVLDINEEDVTNYNLIEFFKFDSLTKLNSFLYSEASMEIYAHADQMSEGIMNHFNNFITTMDDDGEHSVEIVSCEVNKAIQSTLFFLSKTGCRAENIKFVKKYVDEWGDADLLITANPKALESKPNGKISIKVNTSYNKNISADYEIDSILDFIGDEEFRNKVLNTKIINYEEI